MPELILRKHHSGSLVPVDQYGIDALEQLSFGVDYKAKLTQPRRLGFHRKAFALLDVIYEAWETPELTHKGKPVMKNKERLRNDLTILAGFYDVVFKFDGTMVLEAKSWSFSRMAQEDFERLYNRLIDVALGNILKHYTRDDIDEQVERILNFV